MRGRRAFSHSTTSTAMCTRRTRRSDRRAIRRRVRSPSSVPLPRCPRPRRTRSRTAPSMSRFRPKGSSSLQFAENGEARAMSKGWAIVTGASGGMGAEFTRALTERGHPVLAVGRGAERLSRLAARVRTNGEVIETLAADLATPEGVETVVARAHALGDVELLVNNAGLSTSGPFLDQSADREIESIRVNVEALYRLTRAILPGMVARNRAGVLNIASIVAFQAIPYSPTYAATKAFALSLGEELACELRASGVRVVTVCPGFTSTGLYAESGVPGLAGRLLPFAKPETVVRAALAAYDAGRVFRAVGFVNQLLAVSGALTPRFVLRWLMAQMFAPTAASRRGNNLTPRS